MLYVYYVKMQKNMKWQKKNLPYYHLERISYNILVIFFLHIYTHFKQLKSH